jgi:CubicO group peptidase (beta-lactamase class C family)
VPARWIQESFRKRSETGERTGYGFLWWIYEPGSLGAAYPELDRLTVYLARGTGGQALFVIPQVDMVVVHRGDTDNGRSVAGPPIWQLVERLVAARAGVPAAEPRLVSVVAQPLASNLPPPADPTFVTLDASARHRVVGDYEMAPGAIARVFEYSDRLFMSIPGQGEAELFATGASTFTIKVAPGVVVAFDSGAGGAVTGVQVTIGRETLRAVRR